MAWLGSWEKRRKITIDQTQIDADLTHFALPIRLGTSVGKTDVDASDIFDEVGANNKKIAVTKSDGTTQLYVEIELWDNANEKALLWVSKSDWVIDSDADTDIYIYFDNSQSDNTTYVGDSGSRTEVWNSDFSMVHHLDSNLLDSTDNNNDVSATGSDPVAVDGANGGKAYDYDTNDYHSIPDDASWVQTVRSYTFEFWYKYKDTSLVNYRTLWGKGSGIGGRPSMWHNTGNGCAFMLDQSGGSYNGAYNQPASFPGMESTPDQAWHHCVWRIYEADASGDSEIWIDGSKIHTDDYCNGVAAMTASAALTLGSAAGTGPGCELDEFRICAGVGVSAAYIKASYQSQIDNVNTFGVTETSGSPSSSNSPSQSPSASMSPSTSPSNSPSQSPSSSPSPGYKDYTRGDYETLPTDDSDLEVVYSAQDIIDVATQDDVMVDQTATNQNAIHQFKDYVATNNNCSLTWEGRSSLAPSSSIVYLQIYNRNTTAWDTVDLDNSSNADTDFILTASVADLTNYKDANSVISCRIYQDML
jgi:hypothetical protein